MTRQVDESLAADLVRAHVHTAGANLDVRPIPTGKFNRTFRVSWKAGRNEEARVVRIAPPAPDLAPGRPPGSAGFLFYEYGMMRAEPEVHRILREKTSVPVPRIDVFDETRSLVDRPFLIMEFLPGRALSDAPVPARRAGEVFRRVGMHLAEAHAIHGPAYGYSGPHRPMEPQPDWASAFRVMWNKLIDDVEAAGFYSKDEGSRFRGLLDEHARAFERDMPASLLHMDVWSQNILVDASGRVTGLVDWDRHLWGDPEIEFAVLDYCGVSVPEFWEGYGRERDESPDARVRHLFYYLYEHQKYIVIRGIRNGQPETAQGYKSSVFDILQRSGLG